MSMKRNIICREELIKMSALEVYEYLLNGCIAKFPDGFVTRKNMKEIIRYVILDKLKFGRDEICDNISYSFLAKYKLKGSRRVFSNCIYEMVSYCFPEYDIKRWELTKVRGGFWSEEKNRKEYMKWLIIKENIDPKKISDLQKITAKLLDKNLGRKAREYSNGIYSLILLVAEVGIKEWQVIDIPKWNEKKAKEAVIWLIEDKLKWTEEDIVQKISVRTFCNNGLGGLIQNYFGHNVIKALNLAYPGKFIRNSNNKIQLV